MNKQWVKWGVLTGVVAVAVVLLYIVELDLSRINVEEWQARIRAYGVWGPVAYVLFFQVRILFLVPIGVLTTAAGVVWGWAGVLYTLIALGVCVTQEFLVARYLARDFARRILKDRLAFLDRYIEKNAFMAIFVLRLVPNIVLDIQNIGLALTKVRFRKYFAATMLGLLPGTVTLVYFGHSLISFALQPQNRWKFILALGLLLGLLGLQLYVRLKQNKRLDGKAADSG